MTPAERQQSLTNAREAYDFINHYLAQPSRQRLEPPLVTMILSLLEGFEILDEKELRQAEAGREFGHLGAEHGSKGGRPKKST